MIYQRGEVRAHLNVENVKSKIFVLLISVTVGNGHADWKPFTSEAFSCI